MQGKKILLIIVFVIVVIGFGALIYFVFIRDLVETGTTNANENINANVNISLPVTNIAIDANVNAISVNTNAAANIVRPSNVNAGDPEDVARGGLTIATPVVETVVGAAEPTSTGTGVRYYDKFSGKFYIISPDGVIRELSDKTFPQVREISWSPTDNKAVVTFPDNSKIIYDFVTNNQITLPTEWDDVKFSPTGDQIAFKNISDQESARWLAISNIDGSEVKLIEPLGDEANNVDVNWSPGGQVVALFRDSYSGTSQEILMVGQYDENFKSIATNGRGFEGVWSPDGKQLLYTIQNAESRYNPLLHIVDASGDQIGDNHLNLGIQTWADRCAFSQSSSFIFCAVPEYLPTGSGFYPEAAGLTNDNIYKINTNTGETSIVALPSFYGSSDSDYGIVSVFLSNNERTLYFIDQSSGHLFEIKLK